MRRISPASIVSWIILLVMVVVTLIPLYVLGINAIKPDVEVKASPITFPSILAWENFPTAFEKGGFARALLNSLKLAVVTSAILVSVGGFCRLRPGAYAGTRQVKVEHLSAVRYGRTASALSHSLIQQPEQFGIDQFPFGHHHRVYWNIHSIFGFFPALLLPGYAQGH